jgi:hypothetical protein
MRVADRVSELAVIRNPQKVILGRLVADFGVMRSSLGCVDTTSGRRFSTFYGFATFTISKVHHDSTTYKTMVVIAGTLVLLSQNQKPRFG